MPLELKADKLSVLHQLYHNAHDYEKSHAVSAMIIFELRPSLIAREGHRHTGTTADHLEGCLHIQGEGRLRVVPHRYGVEQGCRPQVLHSTQGAASTSCKGDAEACRW